MERVLDRLDTCPHVQTQVLEVVVRVRCVAAGGSRTVELISEVASEYAGYEGGLRQSIATVTKGLDSFGFEDFLVHAV